MSEESWKKSLGGIMIFPAMEKQSEEKTPAMFSNFVMGLASAAMIELGVVEDPMTKEKRKNVPLARQHIDMLEMLKEKTAGNLSEEEKALMDSVLTDLKIHFVKHSK